MAFSNDTNMSFEELIERAGNDEQEAIELYTYILTVNPNNDAVKGAIAGILRDEKRHKEIIERILTRVSRDAGDVRNPDAQMKKKNFFERARSGASEVFGAVEDIGGYMGRGADEAGKQLGRGINKMDDVSERGGAAMGRGMNRMTGNGPKMMMGMDMSKFTYNDAITCAEEIKKRNKDSRVWTEVNNLLAAIMYNGKATDEKMRLMAIAGENGITMSDMKGMTGMQM